MTDALALLAVVAAGVYFIILAAVSFAAPSRATSFLMGFATTAGAHYVELAVRATVGLAFIAHAEHVAFPIAFAVFGWVLTGTTAVMLLLPWRCHRAFARRAVPQALRCLPLVATASLAMGGFVLWSVFAARF